MNKLIIFLIVSSLSLIQACTGRNVYEGMKGRSELECRKLPTAEYEDCMRALDKDYESYREQREEVIREHQ